MEVRIDRTVTMRPFVRGSEREGLFVRAETKSATKLELDDSRNCERAGL